MGGSINKIVSVGSSGLIKDASGSEAAADASKDAANTQAAYQREALEYLKQSDRIPQAFREDAIKRLGGMFGVEGFDSDGEPLAVGDPLATQAERIALAQQSPYYQQIMGGQMAGEESILRNAAATGGMRSGNVQNALYDYNAQLQNKALTESYNQQIQEENRMLQGLSGLAQLPSLTTGIANQTSKIGQTLGQGMVGAQQSANAADQAMMGNILSVAAIAASDERLKKDIEKIGVKNGHNWYRWTWNDIANRIGYKGTTEGVIAQEVQKANPEAVVVVNGYLHVNYEALGV